VLDGRGRLKIRLGDYDPFKACFHAKTVAGAELAAGMHFDYAVDTKGSAPN
jgi:hypothetical protein